MAAKKLDLASLRQRTSDASKGLTAADRERRQRAAAEVLASSPARELTLPLDRIRPRQGGDTRPLHPEHVIALAESIAELGLIEAIAIDQGEHLLAGSHRLFALRLLATPDAQARLQLWNDGTASGRLRGGAAQQARLRARVLALDHAAANRVVPHGIPVRIHPLDAAAQPERALQIEIAETEKRRDYSRDEVLLLIERLQRHGYVIKHGKLKEGEKPLLPELSKVLGKSIRQVQRVLGGKPAAPRRKPLAEAGVPATAEALLALIDRTGLGRRHIAELLQRSLTSTGSLPVAVTPAASVRNDVLALLREALDAAQDFLDAEGVDLARRLRERCGNDPA